MSKTIQDQIQNLINNPKFAKPLNGVCYGHVEFVIRDGCVYNVLFVKSELVRPEDRNATEE